MILRLHEKEAIKNNTGTFKITIIDINKCFMKAFTIFGKQKIL